MDVREMPIILVHCDTTGVKTRLKLTGSAAASGFYLPDVVTSTAHVSHTRDDGHSSIKLEPGDRYCLLSVYSSKPRPTIVLGDISFELPLSTPTHQKSVFLTEQHRLVTPTGQWQFLWDVTGDLSMQIDSAPLSADADIGDIASETVRCSDDEIEETIELVPSPYGSTLIERRELLDENDMEECGLVPITEIRLSPASAVQDEVLHMTSYPISEDVQSTTQDDSRIQSKQSKNDTESGPDSFDINNDDDWNQATMMFHNDKIHSKYVEYANVSSQYRKERPSFVDVPETTLRTMTEATGDIVNTERNHQSSNVRVKVNTSDQQQVSSSIFSRERSEKTSREQGSLTSRVTNSLAFVTTSQQARDKEKAGSEEEAESKSDSRVPKRRLTEIEQDDSPREKKARTAPESISSASDSDSEDTYTAMRPSLPSTNGAKPRHSKSFEPSGHQPSTQGQKSVSSLESLPAGVPYVLIPPKRPSQSRPASPDLLSRTSSVNPDNVSPKIVFGSSSEISGSRKIRSTIKALGGKVVHDIFDADVLCIGRGEMKKTSKFIIAVATGKDIVTDDWLERAHIDQEFPGYGEYLPKDAEHEGEWGFSLKEAIERGKSGLKLLRGTHVYFTAQLRKDLGKQVKELKDVAITLGAASVRFMLPKKGVQHMVVVVGSAQNIDREAATIERLGHKLYRREVLTMAALRGKLELSSDEFKISVPAEKR